MVQIGIQADWDVSGGAVKYEVIRVLEDIYNYCNRTVPQFVVFRIESVVGTTGISN